MLVPVIREFNAAAARNLWDVIRSRMKAPGACVLAGKTPDGKAIVMAAGTPEAVAAGFNAVDVIHAASPAIKGGGGGKPDMAQAGGKNPEGVNEALAAIREMF